MYIQSLTDNQWYKQALSGEIADQFKGYMTNSDDTYNVMKKQLANANTAGGQIGNDVKIENIAVKYLVDKNTYLASSSTVSFDFEM